MTYSLCVARLPDQMPGFFDPLVIWVGCLLFSGLTLTAGVSAAPKVHHFGGPTLCYAT